MEGEQGRDRYRRLTLRVCFAFLCSTLLNTFLLTQSSSDTLPVRCRVDMFWSRSQQRYEESRTVKPRWRDDIAFPSITPCPVQPLSKLCSMHPSLPPLGYLSPIYDLIEPYPILSLSMYVHDRTRDDDNDDDDGYNDLALFLSTGKSNSKRKSNK